MFSLKDSIRRTITATIVAAMATTVFVGCAKQDTISEPDITSTPSITTSISDNLTPGVEDTLDIVGNTLFHWVEEPVGASLAVSISDFLEGAEQDTGEVENEYGLPVFVKETTKYLHSGNLMLQLTEDGDIANEQDEMLVRHVHEPNTASGGKIYIYRGDDKAHVDQLSLADGEKIIERTDKFWQVLGNDVSTDHTDYVVANTLAEETVAIPSNALVWYNGISTDIRANGKLIPLNVLTGDFVNILNYTKTDSGYEFTLYTGIGAVKIDATANVDSWVFKYTLPAGCTLEQPDVTLPVADMTEADDTLYVSADVLTKVFNYFVFSFSSVDMGDGSTDDIAVIITDNQDIIRSDKAARDEANRKAQEQQAALEELIATPEQEEQAAKDKQDRQDMADNTPAYTIDGIPLTTSGGLTEPAKPTKDYKLPKNAQLEFTGDASKAERTTLPDGCYWTPSMGYPNAFTDPAGNTWINNKIPETTGSWGRVQGYYDATGDYNPSQAEIDHTAAINAAIHDINVNGPSYDGTNNNTTSNASQEEIDALLNRRGH